MNDEQTWGSTDPTAAAAAATELGGSRMERLTLAEGRNVLRFLPPPKGKPLPFTKVYVHWLPTADGKNAPVGCPRKVIGPDAPCTACARVVSLRSTGHPADDLQAKSLAAKVQVYAQVVDLTKPETAAKGVQTIAFSSMIYEELLSFLTDPTDPVDFTHPEKGVNVIIDRAGTSSKTRYKVRLSRQASSILALPDGVGMQCLSQVRDLAPEAKLKLLPGTTPPAGALPASSGQDAMSAASAPADADEPAWFAKQQPKQ